jgi:ribose transport system permease protein
VLVDIAPDASIATSDEAYTITEPSGATRTYPRTEWNLREDQRKLRGSVEVNKFFEKENLVLLTTKASYFAVMAVGMTAIIVLAGIDLSVGSIYAVAAIVGAMALRQLAAPIEQGGWGMHDASAWVSVPVGLAVCCAVGTALGLFNGAMIVGLRLHPFIITLGTMAIYRGLVLLLTRGLSISELPDSLQRGFFKASYFGVYPVLTGIMVLVAIVGTFVLSRTVLGRRIYAIGGNETAAYYAGIPVGRVKLMVFSLGGMLAGLSACMEVGYNGAASVAAGQGYELNVIAAAVIGGASLSGGRGSALGAVLGAILVALIDNAMVILSIDQSYNQVVMGGAIVLAVVFDQLKLRFLARR